MIHKSEAIAEHSWCGGADYAYVYRYEDGAIKYLDNDSQRWRIFRDVGISDEEADRQAAAWGVKEGDLPRVIRLDLSFNGISYTCDGITFGGQSIPIQTMKYALGQLVPFVYEHDGKRRIKIQPTLLMGMDGVLTTPNELERIIKTWELVNEKKECTYCGIYLDKAETLCESCNRGQPSLD